MTNDEEADEIIRRLQQPPTRRLTSIWTLDSLSMISDEVADIVTQAISDEIDAEVLEKLRKLGKKL